MTFLCILDLKYGWKHFFFYYGLVKGPYTETKLSSEGEYFFSVEFGHFLKNFSFLLSVLGDMGCVP